MGHRQPDRGADQRLVDLILASALLALTAPIILAAAALIRSTSAGPVIYRQKRVGRFGAPFTILKFRTMADDAEPNGAVRARRGECARHPGGPLAPPEPH